MGKEMAGAYKPKNLAPMGHMVKTGIKLEVVERNTGKPVNYGVQLNNTTLEIEALPNLKVEIVGIGEMRELIQYIVEHKETISYSQIQRIIVERAKAIPANK